MGMKLFKKFTLTILFIPFLLIILLSSLNLNNKLSLRILLWKTPKLSIGTYIFLGYSFGFISSFSSFAIISTSNQQFKRKVKSDKNNYSEPNEYQENSTLYNHNEIYDNQNYIERDIRDPSPTLTVPYRVIHNTNDSNDIYSQEESYDELYSTQLNESPQNNNEKEFNNYTNFIGWEIIDLENW